MRAARCPAPAPRGRLMGAPCEGRGGATQTGLLSGLSLPVLSGAHARPADSERSEQETPSQIISPTTHTNYESISFTSTGHRSPGKLPWFSRPFVKRLHAPRHHPGRAAGSGEAKIDSKVDSKGKIVK